MACDAAMSRRPEYVRVRAYVYHTTQHRRTADHSPWKRRQWWDLQVIVGRVRLRIFRVGYSRSRPKAHVKRYASDYNQDKPLVRLLDTCGVVSAEAAGGGI